MPKKRFLYFIFLVLLLFSLCACEEEDDSNGNKRRKNDYSGTETPTPTAETKTVSPTSQITVEPIETSPTPTDNAWPISAEEIYNAIVEVCFEIPGEGSSEEARIPWTRYFHSNEGARAITCDMDDGHTFFVCLKGNEIVLSQSDGKELFVNEICSACDMPSPFGKDGGDKNECDAKKVVQLLYNELIPGGFSERVYNLIYPNDVYVIQKAKSNAQTKADIWDYGFDLFDFSVEQYRGFCDEYESGCFAMFPNVVLCEDAYNPIKTNQLLNGDNKPGTDAYHDYTLSKDWFFGDEGASVYVLVVEWGYMKEGFDHIGFLNENNREPYYDEFDVHGRDVVWVYRYNGRWYVAGKIFGFDTYAVEMD